MPLPWLIGIAAVAAVAAVAKAVSDDGDSSSSSDDSQRHEQERLAKREKQRQSLSTQLANLKKNQITRAHDILRNSVEALSKNKNIIHETRNKERLESALKSQVKSTSEYAKAMANLIKTDEISQGQNPDNILKELLMNIKVFDSLFLSIALNDSERTDIKNMKTIVSRLERLQKLKNQLELQE